MKKLFAVLAFLIGLIMPVKADVMPYYVGSLNANSIGLYQAANNIKIYKEPNVNSALLLDVNWDSKSFDCPDVSASNLFAVYLPKKNLAFLTVLDENDNEDWVQVSYSKDGNQKGWIKKDDDLRFMPWRSFFNIYGRKYGLYYMKDAPEETKVIRGTGTEDSPQIGRIMYSQAVKLTAVKGNWLLVTAMDVDRTQKIGWIKWRNISGEIYLFPDIK